MHQLKLEQVDGIDIDGDGIVSGGIASSGDGKYFATALWDEIKIFNMEGGSHNLLYSETATTCVHEDLYEPEGICFVADSYNILVCSGEAAQPLIVEFTVKGQHLRSMRAHSRGVHIIHDKDVFLTAETNTESTFFSGVVVYDYALGTQIRIIGCYGSGPGQLNFPCGLALTLDGHVLVCDSGNQRVCKFNAETGSFVGHVFATPNQNEYPAAVREQQDGNYLVLCTPDSHTDDTSASLYSMRPQGGITDRFILSPLEESWGMAFLPQTETLLLAGCSPGFMLSDFMLWALQDGWLQSTRCAFISALVCNY
jgi:hypothetical protein